MRLLVIQSAQLITVLFIYENVKVSVWISRLCTLTSIGYTRHDLKKEKPDPPLAAEGRELENRHRVKETSFL